MTRRSTSALLAVSGAAVLGALGGCAGGGEPAPTSTVDPAAVADGSYTAVGEYQSPAGQTLVEVTLEIADGTVTAVDVEPRAEDPTARQFQEMFASGIADQVVGRPVDELGVSRVAGSSLTSQGFADAVAQILADAGA